MGTQDGLHLRNLLWHGFLSKDQFDPGFTSFLMLCVLSLKSPSDHSVTKKFANRANLFPPKDFKRYVDGLDFGLGPSVFPGDQKIII